MQSGQGFASIYPRLDLQNNAEEDQPVYVNAKQYNRIIERRKARAKWEAEHPPTKRDHKYMHESRHKHAIKRPRGSGTD
ncbi:uncharacterized protein [Blastocystis hominis]|uniref:Nuclear transcription factor Y subunit n=1 Tax=Blastocystis hominis TaxID=12968 RepID=D8LZU7_BLAHO|nr:uncharacterized protein [Blastocystis hominis]CBK21336.2 unnamed protein product [Blastocystis hominis]|eukprot:XP_012895384.1 uncharacterized protein [Blastocystis hominis]